jgi:hypothetical protein
MKDSSHPDEAEIVRRLTESRVLQDAPEDLVAKAIALWDQRPRRRVAPRLLAAILSFDTFAPNLALPSTRAHEEARQLLYSIEGRDVDLRIRRSSALATGAWAIVGQVLGPEQAGRISVRCGAFEAQVPWTANGEFHLEPVPAGECTISLDTDEWQAVLPTLLLPPAT